MPKDFERCVERGGKVRTESGPSKKHGLEKDEYVRYCTIDGKTYRGEVKKKKSGSKNNKEGKMNKGDDVLNLSTKEIPKKVPKRALWFDDVSEQFIEFKKTESGENERKGSMVGYSGQPMEHWLFGKIAVDVNGIKFGKGKTKFPVLEEHERARKIGFSKRPSTEDNKLTIDEFTVLENSVAEEFYSNALQGYPYQASISIKPKKIEEIVENTDTEVNGFKLKGPAMVIRESEYRETSVCTFGADANTSVSAFSDDEELEELDIEVVSNYNKGNTNQSSKNNTSEQEVEKMKLSELKEKHPELVTELKEEVRGEFSDQVKQKDDQIASLTQEKETLSNNNTELSNRVQKLEKQDIIRTEKEIKASAKAIVDERIAQTNFSDRIKAKVRAQFNHEQFVDENNHFDDAKFREHVDNEVKDWEASLSESAPSTVSGVGVSKTDQGQPEFSDQDVESYSSRLLNYVVEQPSE